MLLVKIITAFPEMFPGVLGHSIIGNSFKKKWDLEIINLRNFGIDERKTIDDTPFGGGPGMIIRPDVVEKALIQNQNSSNINAKLIYMSPSGRELKQQDLLKYCKFEEIIILCGRFEGVDTRAIEVLGFEEVSIGDYVLNGGEVAAQVLLEGCIRLIPGVLGHPESILEESFSEELLEHPHYTKPKVWIDENKTKHNVPDILLSGHHEKIKEWRLKKSVEKTKKNRPDLIKNKKELS